MSLAELRVLLRWPARSQHLLLVCAARGVQSLVLMAQVGITFCLGTSSSRLQLLGLAQLLLLVRLRKAALLDKALLVLHLSMRVRMVVLLEAPAV